MVSYLCTAAPPGGWDLVNESGQLVNVGVGGTTTLRADYATALGAYFDPVGAGAEDVLTVREQDALNWDASWSAAVADGFEIANDGDVELAAYFDGTGGGTRSVTIEGAPDLVLSLASGVEQRSGRLSTARFGTTVLVHFDNPAGVYVIAVRKEAV